MSWNYFLWKTQIIKRMTSPQGADCPLPKGGAKGYWSSAIRELTRKSSPWVGVLARGRSEGFMQSTSPASRRFGIASCCVPWLSLNPPGPETGGGLWGDGALNLDKRFPLLVLESHAGFQIEVFSSNLIKREWAWKKAFPEVQVLGDWRFSHRKEHWEMAERQWDATERNACLKMSFGKVHRHMLACTNTPTRVHGERRAHAHTRVYEYPEFRWSTVSTLPFLKEEENAYVFRNKNVNTYFKHESKCLKWEME